MLIELQTVHALRRDVALQIARHVERLGESQLSAAKRLAIAQPTLSKIVSGRTEGISLELLLRIAVRAGLRLTLQTGLVPQEAGAYVSGHRPHSGRRGPSGVARQTDASLKGALRMLSHTERLETLLEHNQLSSELADSARAADSARLSSASRKR
jgi:predicted XRE-type DNA-binding protein